MFKVTPYGWEQAQPNNLCQLFFISLGSESPRREVYGEGLSMPRAGSLREYSEGVEPTLRDAWGTLRKCTSNQIPDLPQLRPWRSHSYWKLGKWTQPQRLPRILSMPTV